ncbi:MAG: response regulator transcription factor [Halanaerobium sp.]|nr:response regulator transcription factor [Halanaerobium sp.]
MEKKVLVVDDDRNLCRLLEIYLKKGGFEVLLAHDGRKGIELARQEEPNLVILDIMLPGKDGWEVCQEIRRFSDMPIIMLTAKGEKYDRISGLDLGADIYLTKPFDPDEVVAQVKAFFRRWEDEKGEGREDVLKYDGLEINKSRYQVYVSGEKKNLAPKEFELLWFLAQNPGQVFSREKLLDRIWGYDFYGDIRTVDTHVKRLRDKLKSENGQAYLQTVWGVGYKFEVEEDE